MDLAQPELGLGRWGFLRAKRQQLRRNDVQIYGRAAIEQRNDRDVAKDLLKHPMPMFFTQVIARSQDHGQGLHRALERHRHVIFDDCGDHAHLLGDDMHSRAAAVLTQSQIRRSTNTSASAPRAAGMSHTDEP